MSLLTLLTGLVGKNTAGTPAGPSSEIGMFINEPFDGSALPESWTPGGSPTITVSAGKCRIVGTSTIRNGTQHIRNSGYGFSMLRQFVIETGFKINAIGSNGFGPFLAARSQVATSFGTSLFGVVNYGTGFNELVMYGGDNSDAFMVGIGTGSTLTPSINTTDDYLLRLTVSATQAVLFFKNVTTGQQQTKTYTYGWDAGTYFPERPNVFEYSLGVAGNSDISFDYFTATSTEHNFPVNIFIGDSITTGYMKGAGQGYPELLAAATADLTEISAGGGVNCAQILLSIPEVIARQPQRVFIMGGTNDNGDFTVGFTNLQTIVSQLTTAGIDVYPLLIVNGGNPGTAGTFNHNVATTYAAKYIDTWTTGWNTMSTGNGEMSDALHPTATGFIKLANIIKAAKPLFFPL